jgi:hypothetical protein
VVSTFSATRFACGRLKHFGAQLSISVHAVLSASIRAIKGTLSTRRSADLFPALSARKMFTLPRKHWVMNGLAWDSKNG